MSADTLRRAAALMRERAKAATPGPWAVDDQGSGATAVLGHDRYAVTVVKSRPERAGNAEHIASWHPAVALAVADWLDATARTSPPDPHYDNERCETCANVRQALAVARAYLGEQGTDWPDDTGEVPW